MNNRILCVDDEKDIVQAYVDFLAPAPAITPKRSSRSAGSEAGPVPAGDRYEIFKACSGESAVELVKSEFAAGLRVRRWTAARWDPISTHKIPTSI